MSVYMRRLFSKSNSSLLLQPETAIKATVHRIKQDTFLADPGLGTPKLCNRDALASVPSSTSITRFHNNFGFVSSVPSSSDTTLNRLFLERYFVDIVAGDETAKALATARVMDLIGSEDETGAGGDEPMLMLPRRYRQKQVFMELNRIWRQNKKVNGFVLEKVRGGYLVAIAGYIAYLPFRPMLNQRLTTSSSFTISSITMANNRLNIVVF